MKISNIMKDSIKKHFYTDDIILFKVEEGIDDTGGRLPQKLIKSGEFKGNARPISSYLREEKSGLLIDASIVITASPDVIIEENDIIYYNDIYYKVKEVLKYDSHIKIVGDKDERKKQ